jgi:hypothetical protein
MNLIGLKSSEFELTNSIQEKVSRKLLATIAKLLPLNPSSSQQLLLSDSEAW